MQRLTLFINRVLHLFEVRRIKTKENIVFLTFDDGPEPEITEFVLDELRKYQLKATFFCRGDNAEKHPVLLQHIVDEGHALGNHTYSHIKSVKIPTTEYVEDVERADKLLHTHLFRPPWGCITLPVFMRLCRKYKIVYWSLESGDTELERFNKSQALHRLLKRTRSGDVVLFHCCQRHEKETRQLLPEYLKWLSANGYTSKSIN